MRWDLLFPDIRDMFDVFVNNFSMFMENLWATFSVSIVGAGLAVIFAISFSVFALKLKAVDYIMQPIVAISQSFPLQAITPVIIIVMGIGFETKSFIAFLIAFFPIYGSCITSMKTTPKNLICFSRIYNALFFQEVFYIRIPYALPAITSAAKVGFTLAVLGAVVAEFMQPNEGMGRLILSAQSNYNMASLYVCIILLAIQGLIIYVSLSKLEEYFINKGGFKNE